MEEAIVYAYGFAAPSNGVLSYCKKSDVIFCDEKVNFALEQGILAAKSIIIYFRHNDVLDLQRKLENACKKECPMSSLRKFLIIEGLYTTTGTICPLKELMEIVQQYKLRIFIDESISLAVLGEKGHGVTEHFSIDTKNVDMIIGSLEGSLGSVGSFCASSRPVIEHQRLSSAGYVFSASLPTFQAQAAITALDIIETSSDQLGNLQFLSNKMHKFLVNSGYFDVISNPLSPHLVFNFKNKKKRCQYKRKIREFCQNKGVYLAANENGLVINLNVALFYQENKFANICKVLELAAESLINLD